MLYTRRGDQGQTGVWGCDQKIAKSSAQAEALGALDEINSFLGVIKTEADKRVAKILAKVQQDLFVAQAEIAGVKKKIKTERVVELEEIIDEIEKKIPPIKTFIVAGGTKCSALLDYSRTVARRAERRVIAVAAKQKIGAATLAYLNRLSSLLYALARLENHKAGIREEKPNYE